MIFSFFLIIINFLFCESHATGQIALQETLKILEKARAGLLPKIPQNFLRAVTQGEREFQPLSPANLNAFINRNYSSNWITKPIQTDKKHPFYGNSVPYDEWDKGGGEYITPAFYQTLYPSPSSSHPFTQFHEDLSQRFQAQSLANHDVLGFSRYIISTNSNCSYLRGFKPASFFNGHQIILHGKTVFPIMGISIFDPKQKKDDKEKYKMSRIPQKWLTPLEQALLISSRDEYVKQLAILRDWGSYSRFALGYIPTGSQIVASVGLVAPQWSPDDLFKSEGKSPTEYQEGGATQFYIHSISNMHWVDIDVLEGDKLNVAEGLHKLGLLTEEERKVITDFRGHWSQLA